MLFGPTAQSINLIMWAKAVSSSNAYVLSQFAFSLALASQFTASYSLSVVSKLAEENQWTPIQVRDHRNAMIMSVGRAEECAAEAVAEGQYHDELTKIQDSQVIDTHVKNIKRSA